MCEPVLQLKNVTLRRGSFSLEGIDLALAKGEILALLGRTGAGKTLLLETAAGFCPPPPAGRCCSMGGRYVPSRCTGGTLGICIRNTACFPI